MKTVKEIEKYVKEKKKELEQANNAFDVVEKEVDKIIVKWRVEDIQNCWEYRMELYYIFMDITNIVSDISFNKQHFIDKYKVARMSKGENSFDAQTFARIKGDEIFGNVEVLREIRFIKWKKLTKLSEKRRELIWEKKALDYAW